MDDNNKIHQIKENLSDDLIKSATDEELMGYLFLSEKFSRTLKKIYDLEEMIELDKEV